MRLVVARGVRDFIPNPDCTRQDGKGAQACSSMLYWRIGIEDGP